MFYLLLYLNVGLIAQFHGPGHGVDAATASKHSVDFDSFDTLNNGNISDVWESKLRHYFHLYDFNKDGFVTKYEHVQLFASRTKYHLGVYQEIADMMAETWDEFWSDARVNYKPFLTADDCVESHRNITRYSLQRIWARTIFGAADTDHSGFLDLEEHKKLMACFNIPSEGATLSFQAIDEDQSGVLEKGEFTLTALGYVHENKLTRNAYLFGKIDD